VRKIATVAACAFACATARADGTDQAKTASTDAKPAGAHTADAHAAPRTIDLEKAREWWSYRPIADAPPPAVRDAAWIRNDIDRFILARLEADGLVPAPEADRVALIRRATYDLTGLPPTPAEVDAFLADHDPHAWERVVDRLLASQHYGERWGRHWLDLVRYADTNGFERDGDKPGTWRYRDWVIGAMNQDKPYDRFITEQLAGDELPDRDFSTMVATGYYRLGMWDDEVPDLKQALADDMDGIVDVTARTMLGVGLGCARCHDHKGDPIPQRDYYAFSAFFAGVRPYKSYAGNSIEARNVTRSIDPEFGRRDLEAERIAFRERRSALVESLLAIESAAGLLPPANGSSGTAPDRAPTDGLVAHYAFETEATAPEADRAVVRSTVPGPTAKVKDLRWGERGCFGLGGTFDGGDDRVLLDRPVADDFTISSWFRTDRVAAGDDSDPRWFLGSGIVDGEVPGIVDDFGISMIGNGIVAAGIGNPETFLNSAPGHNDGQWHHVALTRERASGTVVLYLDGVEVDRATSSTRRLDSPPQLAIGGMLPGGGPFSGQIDEVRIHQRVLVPEEVLSAATGVGPASTRDSMASAGRTDDAQRWATARAELVALRPPAARGEVVLSVSEVGLEPAPVHVLTRGSPHAPSERVEPAVPAVLSTFAHPAPSVAHGESTGRRTALAAWITDPRNRLASRVAANRLWQHHFGVGIVPSSNDFGRLGDKPTHPELLDWLARRLMADGWSLKAMHRLMMTSATYRMACVPGDDALAKDPGNERLSRFRLRRLSAEELRDSLLAANGTINLELGGPGVRPPLPEEVLATSSRPHDVWPLTPEPSWTRRSVYMHQKRSIQDPLLAVFDQADIDNPCPVRFATVQPTQSLILFNGDFANEQARRLADRARGAAPGSERDRAAAAIRFAYGRTANAAELDAAERFMARLADEGVPDADRALDLFALMLVNSNEFLHVD
jgi:hypothetical protein